jgi:hypothetical protein
LGEICKDGFTDKAVGGGVGGIARGVVGTTIGFGGQEGKREEKRREALNCVRLLERVIPILFEYSSKESSSGGIQSQPESISSTPALSSDPIVQENLEQRIFWSTEISETEQFLRRNPSDSTLSTDSSHLAAPQENSGAEEDNSQFIIDDEDEEPKEETDPLKSPTRPTPPVRIASNKDQVEPLAKRLIKNLLDMLFLVGFTIDESLAEEGKRVELIIW